MGEKIVRTYSQYTEEAVALLGRLIRTGRLEQKIPAQELAERAGISRGTLQRIEKGELRCEIGAAFELAALVGVRLFDTDAAGLHVARRHAEERLALLPKAARGKVGVVDDDF